MEPLLAQREKKEEEVRDLLGELRRRGRTLLLSSHIVPDLEALADAVDVGRGDVQLDRLPTRLVMPLQRLPHMPEGLLHSLIVDGVIAGVGGVRVNKAGCLDRCAGGPVAVVYPEGVWYTVMDKADVNDIVDTHLKNGQVVERLVVPANVGR